MEFRERALSFEEVDRRYADLKRRYDSGAVNDEEFDAQLVEMMVQDRQDCWWGKSRDTGEWMYHDGNAWFPGKPPGYQQSAPAYQQNSHEAGPDHGPGPVEQPTGAPAGRWITWGIICAVLALLLFFPAAALGIYFGYRARKAGRERDGNIVMIANVAAVTAPFVIDFILGFAGVL